MEDAGLMFDDLAMQMFDNAESMWHNAQVEDPDPSWQINCYVWESGSMMRLIFRLGALAAAGGASGRHEYTRSAPHSIPKNLIGYLPLCSQAVSDLEMRCLWEKDHRQYDPVLQYIRSLYAK